jgi:hypothetical protein
MRATWGASRHPRTPLPADPAHLDACKHVAAAPARHHEERAGGVRAKLAVEHGRRVERDEEPVEVGLGASVVIALVPAQGDHRAKLLRGAPG